MTREAEKLYEAAVGLPEDERAALVMKLLDTIGRPKNGEAAQSEESRSRLGALEDGAIAVMNDDEAMHLIAG